MQVIAQFGRSGSGPEEDRGFDVVTHIVTHGRTQHHFPSGRSATPPLGPSPFAKSSQPAVCAACAIGRPFRSGI